MTHYLEPAGLAATFAQFSEMYATRASMVNGADRITFDTWAQQCSEAVKLIRALPTVVRSQLCTTWMAVDTVTRSLDEMGLFHRVTRVRLEDHDPFATGLGWLVEVFAPEKVTA